MSSPGDSAAMPDDSDLSESPVVTPYDESEPSSLPSISLTRPSPNTIRIPSLRSISDPPTTASSTPLGPVSAARRAPGTVSHTPFASSGGISKDFQARLQAFQQSRTGVTSPSGGLNGRSPMPSLGGGPFVRPSGPHNWNSSPILPGGSAPKPSLAQRRMNFPGGLPGTNPPPTTPIGASASSPKGGMKRGNKPGSLTDQSSNEGRGSGSQGSLFDKYSQFVDKETGSLKFAGKAVLHGKGVDFSSGSSFNMSLDEVQTLEELGKGNYGTVYKVIHRRPPARRESFNSPSLSETSNSSGSPTPEEQDRSPLSRNSTATSDGTTMAMKEIRLELDENKFAQIIMELDVLHRCRSPYIIDFYGAFFQEGAVYICMEHMDGGSIDKLYHGGVPEGVLRKITYATVMGLKSLKEDHNIIHRDVKPTNILVNSQGDVKLCDFGVSGNLVASIAKTNIGCQSYMAPERIASGGTQLSLGGGGPAGTYGVQSDIWSLGLSILECAIGCYPYPPETYNNIFSQLSAIVDGEPPDLPEEGFSPQARNFVRGCLHKIPKLRPSYSMLLQHSWLLSLSKPSTISEEAEEETDTESEGGLNTTSPGPADGDSEVREWVRSAMEKQKKQIEEGFKKPEKPALHAAPLDVVPSPNPHGNMENVVDGMEKLKTR